MDGETNGRVHSIKGEISFGREENNKSLAGLKARN